MTTRPQLSLGWPFPSGLPGGADWEFLRRAFGDLGKHLSWPLVGLQYEGPGALNLSPIPFTVIPGFDSSSLYRPATDRIYCPQDFNQYLAIGVVAALWTTTATGTVNLGWRKDGAATQFFSTEYTVAGAPRLSVPMIESLNKGQFLTCSTLSTVGGTDLEEARAFCFFVPLR